MYLLVEEFPSYSYVNSTEWIIKKINIRLIIHRPVIQLPDKKDSRRAFTITHHWPFFRVPRGVIKSITQPNT